MSDDSEGLYFNARELPEGEPSYVCWLDIMGIAPTMSRSSNASANFIFKFHTAVIQAQEKQVDLFPIMDGVYAVSRSQDRILAFIRSIFEVLGKEFVGEREHFHQFIPKATLAYGPIIKGSEVKQRASRALATEPEYRSSILIGIPVIQAFSSEGKAPPFGVYVHESARTFGPDDSDDLPYVWWKWYHGTGLGNDLKEQLEVYYDWCKDHSHRISYPSSKIDEHRTLAQEYFLE